MDAELPLPERRESMKNIEKGTENGSCTSAVPFFLTGLGTGIALAVLFAPQSGVATRRLIGRKCKESSDWAKDTAGAAEEYVVAKGAEIRDRAKEVVEVIARG
ncbi:MAG: YtxH domain-containing protein [Bryobacterales bacterium]|nr:YtxH domain-containing protein [Bryobacterales bacterium]